MNHRSVNRVSDVAADAELNDTYLTRLSNVVWETSSRCAGNGSCVEVAQLSMGYVAVRDGMNPEPGKVMIFTREEWRGFLAEVKVGEFGAT